MGTSDSTLSFSCTTEAGTVKDPGPVQPEQKETPRSLQSKVTHVGARLAQAAERETPRLIDRVCRHKMHDKVASCSFWRVQANHRDTM